MIQDNPGEPMLSQSWDLLEQTPDFYEPDILPATQPIASKNYRKTWWFGHLMFYRHDISTSCLTNSVKALKEAAKVTEIIKSSRSCNLQTEQKKKPNLTWYARMIAWTARWSSINLMSGMACVTAPVAETVATATVLPPRAGDWLPGRIPGGDTYAEPGGAPSRALRKNMSHDCQSTQQSHVTPQTCTIYIL